jgi:hypothetical protein
MVPLENAEGQYVIEPVSHATPETLSERRWALTVVDGLLADLRAEWSAQGRAAEFDELKACLLGQAPAGGYAAVAAHLGTSEGAVKAARTQGGGMSRGPIAVENWRAGIALLLWVIAAIGLRKKPFQAVRDDEPSRPVIW